MNETPATTRFTLRIGQWYAAEFIGDEFSLESGHRSYSPIRVDGIAPAGSGQRHFHLSFYHANYPEGVRNKRYSLQTLERGMHFILSRRLEPEPCRLLFIHTISWPWLRAHFGIKQSDDSSDLERWLSNHT